LTSPDGFVQLFQLPSSVGAQTSAFSEQNPNRDVAPATMQDLLVAVEQTAQSIAHASWQITEARAYSEPLTALRAQTAQSTLAFTFENLITAWLVHSTRLAELALPAADIATFVSRPGLEAAFSTTQFSRVILQQLKSLGSV
jgi:hypothetical protein